jgi:hypothetical protein
VVSNARKEIAKIVTRKTTKIFTIRKPQKCGI